MGNCVPIQRNPDPAVKVKCNINSQPGSAQVESVLPFKDNKVNTDHHLIAELSAKPQSLPMPYEASFRDLSNLEEVYFDSQPWLDSDVEDFISVYGGKISCKFISIKLSFPSFMKTSSISLMFPGHRKKKAAYSPQCCLPNLVRSLSSTERRKQLSPELASF